MVTTATPVVALVRIPIRKRTPKIGVLRRQAGTSQAAAGGIPQATRRISGRGLAYHAGEKRSGGRHGSLPGKGGRKRSS